MPRHDLTEKAVVVAALGELRADPYASLQTMERISRMHGALERWFGSEPLARHEVAELREHMLLELAHIETEQRLRSWLMDIVG